MSYFFANLFMSFCLVSHLSSTLLWWSTESPVEFLPSYPLCFVAKGRSWFSQLLHRIQKQQFHICNFLKSLTHIYWRGLDKRATLDILMSNVYSHRSTRLPQISRQIRYKNCCRLVYEIEQGTHTLTKYFSYWSLVWSQGVKNPLLWFSSANKVWKPLLRLRDFWRCLQLNFLTMFDTMTLDVETSSLISFRRNEIRTWQSGFHVYWP